MDRASLLVDTLSLTPHPEGGHYREIYRSPGLVTPDDHRAERSALTSIYFLLKAGEHSSWHLVGSDELWHFCEGDPLELVSLDPATMTPQRRLLGPLDEASQPVRVVPAGQWQAARPLGGYTLVGCSVAPGFEFADFELLRDDARNRERLLAAAPDMASLL